MPKIIDQQLVYTWLIRYTLLIITDHADLTGHCSQINIITPEQAAGKKVVWGCTEQLLMNKAVMSEVRKKRRNPFTIWLDYKTTFNSVPHEWHIYALQLPKQ